MKTFILSIILLMCSATVSAKTLYTYGVWLKDDQSIVLTHNDVPVAKITGFTTRSQKEQDKLILQLKELNEICLLKAKWSYNVATNFAENIMSSEMFDMKVDLNFMEQYHIGKWTSVKEKAKMSEAQYKDGLQVISRAKNGGYEDPKKFGAEIQTECVAPSFTPKK